MRLTSQQVGYAGEHFVAAEIHRRGGYAVTFSGNMKGIDLLASDADHVRKVSIQVKTKRRGDWHASIRDGRERDENPDEDRFWVFVDLGDEQPTYRVAPAWWVENDIYHEHRRYLARHGGRRAVNPKSTHHRIQPSRIAEWLDCWDVIGIFPKS